MKRQIKYITETEYTQEVLALLNQNQDKNILVLTSIPTYGHKLSGFKGKIEKQIKEKSNKIPMISYIPHLAESNVEFFIHLKRILSAMDTLILVGGISHLEQLDGICSDLGLDIYVLTSSTLNYYEVSESPDYLKQKEQDITQSSNMRQFRQVDGSLFSTPKDLASIKVRNTSLTDAIRERYQKLDPSNQYPYTDELHDTIKAACYIASGIGALPYADATIQYLELWYFTGLLNIPFEQLELVRKALNQLN